MAKWQTQPTQNRSTERSCGFDSHLRYQSRRPATIGGPKWRNGRRIRLKIGRSMRSCGFESRLRHQQGDSTVKGKQ